MGRGDPAPGDRRDLGVGDVAEVGEGDVGGEPAPLLQQVQGATAVQFGGPGHVDLLVGLGAPPQTEPARDLPHGGEGRGPVCVHTRRPHGQLAHPVGGGPAGRAGQVRSVDRLDRRRCGIRVVSGGAADEGQSRSQRLRAGVRSTGDLHGVRARRPGEVVVGHGGDAAQQ
ncbi:hypothetical protein BFG51_15995 [Dietzia alimentaria]|nr:hypothetical protein BFG51_15995 [Dietzia alimentaria]